MIICDNGGRVAFLVTVPNLYRITSENHVPVDRPCGDLMPIHIDITASSPTRLTSSYAQASCL